MILFQKFELKNFVIFEDICLEFSNDSQKPLTIVRGENETGKTTLMRGLQWVLFGDSAFPDLEFGHPFRPLWAQKQEGSIATEGTLYFTVADPENRTPGTWKIVRSATSEYSEEDERYSSADQNLVVFHEKKGEWSTLSKGNLDIVIQRFFPTETRGFYFVDADEADEFVGGSEGQNFSAEMMRASITRSLRHLLGLQTLVETTERLNQIANDFGKQASKLSGSDKVQQFQEQLGIWQGKKETALERRNRHAATFDAAQVKIDEYDKALAGLGEQEEILDDLRRDRDDRKGEYDTALNRQVKLDALLSTNFGNENFFAALMKPLLVEITDELEPMREEGTLPPHEVSLLPKLLQDGKCVCSTDFDEEPDKKEVVEKRLAASKEFAKSREFLHSILVSAERQNGLTTVGWADVVDEDLTSAKLGQIEVNAAEDAWELAQKAFDDYAKNSDNQSIAENLSQRKYWESERSKADELRLSADVELAEAVKEERSYMEKIRVADAGDARAQPLRQQETAARRLEGLMKSTAERIENEQIPEVSSLLNGVFRDAIGATDDSQFSEVGIEPIQKQAETQYGLYSKDAHGDPKDLGIANGASRRALGVAFVLALTDATQSAVPFVADSLLHALSGKVKENLVDALVNGSTIDQPILFCTRDDVLAENVASVIKRQAGKSYTLTSQANVGSNAVRYADAITDNRRCSVLCECSISEFCQICEELGDKESGLLTERVG